MGIREDLKIPLTMLSISFLNKLPFKGSYNGKRFMFQKVKNEKDNSDALKLYVWDDVYNFENTQDSDKVVIDLPFTKEGIEEGIDYIEKNSSKE